MRIRGGGAALAVLLSVTGIALCSEPQDPSDTTAPPVAPAQQAPAIAPLTVRDRGKYHLKRAFGPEALATSAVNASVQTWRGRPEGWGQDAEGFAQRFGMRMSRSILSNSIMFGIGAATKDDPRYRRSGRTGAFPRIGYAITRSFLHHDQHGKAIPAYSRFAGVIGSNVLTRTWYPPGDDRWDDTARRSAFQLGSGVIWNILREFKPDILRKLGR